MPIPVTCLCGRSLRIKDELAGKRIRCPDCSNPLVVPEVVEATEAEEEDFVPQRRIQTQPRSQLREAEEEKPRRPIIGSSIPRDEEPAEERPRPKPKKRRPPRESYSGRGGHDEGWFGSINAGAIGGLLMIFIAIVWFVGGLMGGIIFFYPPILFVIGCIACIKGMFNGE